MSEIKSFAEVVEVADQVELRVIDLDTGETRRYKSNVLDVSADRFAVSMPSTRGMPLALADGTALVVAIWKGFADHLFKSQVLAKEGGRIPQLILSSPAPSEIARKPRREFYRVDCRLPVRLSVPEGKERKVLPAVIVDLSAGGCRLRLQHSLRHDTRVHLDFNLPFPADQEGMDRSRPLRQVPAKVRAAFDPPEPARDRKGKRPLHALGIEFARLDNVTQNALLRYVAFRQREILNQFKEVERSEHPGEPSPETAQIEERLSKLESDLAEAGQPVPQVTSSDPPPLAPAIDESDLASIDELFAPVADSQPSSDSPQVQPPRGEASGKTLLLVEDEEALRKVLAVALTHAGHSVIEASDGQQALGIALRTPVDLVITDLMMPRMNGWRLLSALREHGRTMPVCLITGYMSEEGQEVLTSRDIAGFLVKPIDLEDLAHMVDEILFPPPLRRRILAVDDEEDMRLLVSTCLEKAGFQIETAASGAEALARMELFKPDLVILDIVMPGMDGFEVCRRIRLNPATAHLPVIMLTVKSSAEYVRKAVPLKVSGYLIKPFDPEVLVERIRRSLQV